MNFASLLAPMTIAQFRDAWNTQAIAFSGRRDRFSGLAFDFDVLRRTLHMGHTLVNAQYFDGADQHREMAIAPMYIADCFAAGMTICMPNIDAFLPALAAQSHALRRSIESCGAMSFSCYWSPDRGGFGTHYDSHPVWIMQLQGKKQWWYSAVPAIAEPRANLVYTPAKLALLAEAGLAIAEPVGLREVVLEPGDMLYLPAGTWHRTRAIDGPSLALTLRSVKGSPDQVALHLLQRWIGGDRRWRRPLPVVAPGERPGHRLPGTTADVLGERLAALQAHVAALTVDDLARAWAELGSWSDDSLAAPAAPAASDDAPLAPGTRLAVPAHITAIRANDGSGRPCFFVYDGQSELALPAADHAWLERAIAAGEFTARDACDWEASPQPWEAMRERLAALIDDGVLAIRGH